MPHSGATLPPRRLSQRRGSTTAFDPYAKHAEANFNLSSSSTLTILRVVQPSEPPISLHEPPRVASPSHNPLAGRRFGRTPGKAPESAGGSPQNAQPTRLSFAFSSFSSQPSPSSGGPASPTTSSRSRPSSPTLTRANSSGFSSKPRLTPDQLYDLAKQSTNPRNFPTAASTTTTPDVSPNVHRTFSPLGRFTPSPLPLSNSTTSISSVASPGPTIAPATFTPLPDDIYLPFIDRPTEVAALISTAPSSKLFALLKQTFPTVQSKPESASSSTKPAVVVEAAVADGSSDQASPPQSASSSITSKRPHDPSQWVYADLHAWLISVTRSEAPDALWVLKARKCILTHSELIWERVKGALGVPPELDVDGDIEAYEDYYFGEDGEGDELEYGGRKAQGHWDDWDAVVDSPVADKRHSWKSGHGGSPVLQNRPPMLGMSEIEKFRAGLSHERQNSGVFVSPSASVAGDGDTTVSPTPNLRRSPPPPPALVTQPPTPQGSLGTAANLEPQGSFGLSIEPLMLLPEGFSLNPPPAAANDGTNLGDIAEGAEEEEEEQAGKSQDDSIKPAVASPLPEEEDYIDTTQIHGLKFSTAPSTALGLPISPGHLPVGLPEPGFGSPTVELHIPLPLSRSASVSSMDGGLPSRRPSFAGSIGSVRGKRARFSTAGGVSGYESSDYDSEGGYDPVGDRVPGNPLFPSNFARLAVGPTLVANNPSLRSPTLPPHSRYPHPGARGLRRSNSTSSSASNYSAASHTRNKSAEVGPGLTTPSVKRPGSHLWRRSAGAPGDYAVSAASESSVTGEKTHKFV